MSLTFDCQLNLREAISNLHLVSVIKNGNNNFRCISIIPKEDILILIKVGGGEQVLELLVVSKLDQGLILYLEGHDVLGVVLYLLGEVLGHVAFIIIRSSNEYNLCTSKRSNIKPLNLIKLIFINCYLLTISYEYRGGDDALGTPHIHDYLLAFNEIIRVVKIKLAASSLVAIGVDGWAPAGHR
jgi:hypothetical protein